jgi:hypothetical protein
MIGEPYPQMIKRWVLRTRREPPPRQPPNRERLVARLEHAVVAPARRPRMIRGLVAGVALSAAAVAAVVSAARRPHERIDVHAVGNQAPSKSAIADTIARHRPYTLGSALEAGMALRAPPAGEVRIGAADGTALILEPGGDITVADVSSTWRFALRRGALRAHAVSLGLDERFVIDTADVQVEAAGASFRVAVVARAPGCNSITRVSVSDGTVTVRTAGDLQRVSAGREWPAGCEARPATRPARARPQRAPVLSEQNALFAAALRAKREDHPEEALRLFMSLLERYPQSPLVESALAQRMKLLAATDPDGAARAATEYLARFPDGFAWGEAQLLASARR